jgi:glycosyltransferase involved in cell wall biosynthesis
MTASRPLVSILIPVFNGAPLLPDLQHELAPVLDTLAGGSEIIYVDDGSQDESVKVLRQLQEKDPRIRVIELAMNFGQHAAFSAAFANARGRYLVTMDADLQCDPRDIPKLLAPLHQGFDLVSGVRTVRHDPAARRVLSTIVTRLVGGMTHTRLRDMGCPFNALTDEVGRQVGTFGELRRFLKPLLLGLAKRVTEVEVTHRPRPARQPQSSYSATALLRLFMDFLTTSLGDVFAWVFAAAGALTGVFLVLFFVALVAWAVNVVGGSWVAALAALATFSLLVALLGLAGDYLQRIHRQSSGRPFYLIRAIHDASDAADESGRLMPGVSRVGGARIGEGHGRGG